MAHPAAAAAGVTAHEVVRLKKGVYRLQTTRCLYKHYNVLDVLSLQDVVDLIATRTGIFKKDVRAVLDAFKEVV